MASAQQPALIPFLPSLARDRRSRRFRPGSALLLVGSLALATVAVIMARDAHYPVTAGLLFIITVLINGSIGGLVPGLIAAIYVSLVYNLFVRYPVFLQGLDAFDDIFPIFAMTLTAVLSGVISGKLRDRMLAADRARRQLTRLLGYSNELQRAITLDQIAHALTGAVPDRPTLDAILDSVRMDQTLADQRRWEKAVRLGLRRERGGGDRAAADWPERLSIADEQAIASLTVMAVERCELLEEHALAQAAINSERLKTALLSSLSHDLRTPISAISAMAGTLRSYGGTIDGPDRAEMLETILEQCRHLEAFTSKLLSLGRLEAGLVADRFELVDVEEVLGSAMGSIRAAFPDRRIVRRIAPEPALVMASPVLLQQVLANLLDNALRYSPADTQVFVTIERAGDMIAITIADEGCGIAPEDLPHVFERFYRGSNQTGQSGHGLGLAITKAFLDTIGGQVAVTSPVQGGRGTQVRILLPRTEPTPPEEPEPND